MRYALQGSKYGQVSSIFSIYNYYTYILFPHLTYVQINDYYLRIIWWLPWVQ